MAAAEDNNEGNKMAERVLLRVGQKLNGMEEGQVGQLGYPWES